MKPTKQSVAAIVRRPIDRRFLAVRRPPDDDRLPNAWGLPAVTLRPGESPEEGIRRLGREKLGVELEPGPAVGSLEADRGDHSILLTDYEATIIAGEPDCLASESSATRYTAQTWTHDPAILEDAAQRGSLCCQILLDHFHRSNPAAR